MSKDPRRIPVSEALFPLVRRKVLRLFFANPQNRHPAAEVIRRSGMGSGPVQKELRRLQAAGLLETVQEEGQIYYQVVQDEPAFHQLRDLILTIESVPQVLGTALDPLAGSIPVAFIYGSYAREPDTAASDVDVFIVGEVQVEDVARALEPARQLLEREINPSIVTLERFRWNLQIGDPFLRLVIDGAKIFLVGDEDHLAELGR